MAWVDLDASPEKTEKTNRVIRILFWLQVLTIVGGAGFLLIGFLKEGSLFSALAVQTAVGLAVLMPYLSMMSGRGVSILNRRPDPTH